MLISQRNNLNIYTSIEELETVKTKICNANNIVKEEMMMVKSQVGEWQNTSLGKIQQLYLCTL